MSPDSDSEPGTGGPRSQRGPRRSRRGRGSRAGSAGGRRDQAAGNPGGGAPRAPGASGGDAPEGPKPGGGRRSPHGGQSSDQQGRQSGAASARGGQRHPHKQAPKQGQKQSQGRDGAGTPGQREPAKTPAARRHNGPWLHRVDEVSAGGLVLDLDGDVPRGALIGRTDRRGRLLWSLPKGHIEPGETAEQAAVREVAEETGINGEIVAQLGTIDFWFIAEGRRVHKTVHHYLMRAVGGELSDADIEVTEVAWVPLPDIESRLAYPDERGLVDAAGRLLAESA